MVEHCTCRREFRWQAVHGPDGDSGLRQPEVRHGTALAPVGTEPGSRPAAAALLQALSEKRWSELVPDRHLHDAIVACGARDYTESRGSEAGARIPEIRMVG